MLKRTFTALTDVDRRIRALVTLAYAVCCDETPLRKHSGPCARVDLMKICPL
jgi:hypothetical protein